MNPTAKKQPRALFSTDCAQAPEVWEQICEALSRYGHLYVFTDFDGTLADITSVPDDAAIDVLTLAALKQLAAEKGVTVAVLSGRAIPDVSNRVGLPLIYGGDHGLEIHGPDFDFVL